MEESELKDMVGYAPPNDRGEIESYRKLGSMKKLTLGKTEAKKVRTLGRNIIPEVKAIWENVKGEMKCTRQGSPPMVAYIDEVMPIHRSCIRCRKILADGKVNWTYKLRWGMETRNTKRDDEIHNPPCLGCDVFADPIENHICLECELEI